MYRLLIMHMEGRLECEVLDDDGRYVYETHRRVLGVNVAATDPAPFAIAQNGFVVASGVFVERRDVLRALGNLYGIGRP